MSSEEEEDSILGAALAARTAGSSSASSLGPPDLCYLQKSFQRKALVGGLLGAATPELGDSTPVGFFHHVIGLDVSSPAPVATYVAGLAAAQQPAGWLASGTWAVQGAVYAAWDCFARQDLWVRVSIPGGVHASVVTPDGRGGISEAPADDGAWRRVYMSALLRALCPPPATRGLRLLPPPLSPAEESTFLDAARALLVEGAGDEAPCTGSSHSGELSHVEMVSMLVYSYFAQSHRHEQALAFFAPLAARGLRPCGAAAAAAQRSLGLLPEAILSVRAHPRAVALCNEGFPIRP